VEQKSTSGLEFSVPSPTSMVEQCPLCEFIFPTHENLVFHMMESHPTQCPIETTKEYEKLSITESDKLFIYHLKICSLLMLTFMGLAYVYAFVLVG